MSERKNFNIYASGAASHILCDMFPGEGKAGQRSLIDVHISLTDRPFELCRSSGLGKIKEVTPDVFLKSVVNRDLSPENQIRRWIFLNQLIWMREAIQMRYKHVDDDQIRIRWNRNKTLVSTANQLRTTPDGPGRREEELILDFGGGQLKSPYTVEDHDASQLLEDLKSGDSERISRSTVRVSALVGKLMGDAAKAGHKGFVVRCLCTGKYWQEIVRKHSDKFLNKTFKLEWIDSDQERDLEFEGCEEAFKGYLPPDDPPSIYIGNLTSGGSSSEMWLVDKGMKPEEVDRIIKVPVPHGSKSAMFWNKDKTALVLPTRSEMMRLFQSNIDLPVKVFEDPIDDPPAGAV